MAERPNGSSPRWHSAIGVGLVAVLAGLMFSTNASIFRDDDDRTPTDLVDLARVETTRLEDNEAAVVGLREQRDAFIDAQSPAEPETDQAEAELISLAAGQSAVAGPGIVVELWDATPPADLPGSGLHPDDLVVHQQDLEAVLNAMWAGGAEALMIQDQRIISTSSVRCVGNVLLLHGRHYSPPYRVSAIGDPQTLRAAVESAPGVQVYRQYVEAYGLGWSLAHEDDIEMPAYTGPMRVDHAQVG